MGKVLHASKSGYFPFCISPNIEYPEEQVSLIEAMKFYWRIKKYKFTMPSSSFTVTSESLEGPAVFSCGAVNHIVDASLASEEEAIVCELGGGGIKAVTLPFIQTYEGESFDATSQVIVDTSIRREGNIETSIKTVGLAVSPEASDFFFIAPAAEGFTQCGTLTSKITDNLTYTFRIFFSLNDVSIAGSFQLLFEPEEYWSYGGTYNTQTGAPL